jgi:hypothetical protein
VTRPFPYENDQIIDCDIHCRDAAAGGAPGDIKAMGLAFAALATVMIGMSNPRSSQAVRNDMPSTHPLSERRT